MNIMRGILRLWVVFSIIWIILAIWAEGNNLYFNALVASFPRYISQPGSAIEKEAATKATPDDSQMALPGSDIEQQLNRAAAAARQQEADDSRAEMTLYAIFYIFMPPLLLAIFGMLALWVYRGFRPRRAQNS
jgi:hypothetical protein